MVDPRGGVEQLHRIGDAVTLAIADNRDARTVRRSAAREESARSAALQVRIICLSICEIMRARRRERAGARGAPKSGRADG